MKKYGLFVVILIGLGSSMTQARSYLSLISNSDQRGQHCRILSAKAEPNVMGIAIKCREELHCGKYRSKNISLVWAKQDGIKDELIQKHFLEQILSGNGSKQTTVWITAKIRDNPRKFSATHAHVVVIDQVSARSSRGAVEYSYSLANKNYFEQSSDSDSD